MCNAGPQVSSYAMQGHKCLHMNYRVTSVFIRAWGHICLGVTIVWGHNSPATGVFTAHLLHYKKWEIAMGQL